MLSVLAVAAYSKGARKPDRLLQGRHMSANEKFQADLQQTKADFSQLKSQTDQKADEAKAKIGAQLDMERGKDEAVFNTVRADAKTQLDKLQTQRAQLKSEIATKSGEARVKIQAQLDSIDSQIAASQAAMAEYFDKRDAGEAGLN